MAQEAPNMQEFVESYVKENLQGELASEMKRADDLAKLVMDFSTDAAGNKLANVQTSEGFQNVYDSKGSEKKRWRLDRKKEQVAHNFNAATHLFQKVYYANDLQLNDERELRSAYFAAENGFNMQRQIGSAALFLGYFPLTYRLATSVRPVTLLLWTGAYYYGAYQSGLLPATQWAFQRSLNSSARPYAAKYGVADF